MPDTSLVVATRIAERIRSAIEAESGTIPVTVSIGLADRGLDANPDALFKRADRALYASQASGHNRVTAVAALARRTWEIHHASLGKQRVDPANALISLQFSGRPVTLPWPDGFASGGGEEVPTSGTPAVVRV
jgi:predicted signal transduction protein with EAL and GGDEF domain